MPHSPRLAHKAPVMQAIVRVASRSIQLNLSQSWDMHISLSYVPRLLLLTPTMLFLLDHMWQRQSWVIRNRNILILLTSIPFSLCYSCTCMALLTSYICCHVCSFHSHNSAYDWLHCNWKPALRPQEGYSRVNDWKGAKIKTQKNTCIRGPKIYPWKTPCEISKP